MEIRERLAEFLKKEVEERGLTYIHVSWNHDWLNKLRSMSDGPEKKAEMDRGLTNLLESLEALERGDYEILGDDELIRKLDGPWADEPTIPVEVQKVIDNVSLDEICDKGFANLEKHVIPLLAITKSPF